jgi:hypothetical protein
MEPRGTNKEKYGFGKRKSSENKNLKPLIESPHSN